MMLALLLVAAVADPLPPELPAAAYRERHERVLKELGGCLTVLTAQGESVGVLGDDYRQDGDFLWLSGINEPEAWLLLAPGFKYNKTTLYLKARDPEAERWTGPREPLSPALKERYGVDRVLRGRPDGQALAAGLRAECVAIIAPPSVKDERPDAVLSRQVASALGLRLVYKRDLLARLRAAHGTEELARIERAVAISRAGHEAAARSTVAGATERDVQNEIERAFFGAGATGLSYPSIVGSGPNGAVLHWNDNSRRLGAGELVVVDAAAEYGRYAADITRTYPVSGRFDEEQAKAYRAVYQAQEDVLAAVKPGVSMADLQKTAEESLKHAGYLEYFIHGFGHFVGLDVHDSGSYEAPLPVGAVITVEPGVYLPERRFGIRIEDDVVITSTGYRLLSSAIPRKLEDVESWVAGARGR